MNVYPEEIMRHFLAPRNIGEVGRTDGLANVGSLVCGAVMRLSLTIEPNSQVITDAKFRAAGCGFLIAATSSLTDNIRGLRLGEAVGLPLEKSVDCFASFPPERQHCAMLCREALEAAAINYRSRRLEDWAGEEALICTCFGVAESEIQASIKMGSLETIQEVGHACNAGRGCGSCQPLIQEILDGAASEL